MIFRLRRSDIVASDSDMKAYGFRDILFASKARVANTTRRKPNITAKQYNSPKANKTAQLPYEKLGKAGAFFKDKKSETCVPLFYITDSD